MASSYGAYGEPVQTPQSPSPGLLPDTAASLRDRKKKQQQPRQLLSCTKCRERKVKCDRTKPCSACCARGLPKECHFVLGEGTEFGPIQQSLELRKLRAENQRLKERLLAAKLSLSDDSDDDDGSSTGKGGPGTRRAASRQKRFRTNEHTDSLYFGSPGLANVIADFASLQIESKSLAFTMPRGVDMYANHVSMYPFPALWQATTATEELLKFLKPSESLLAYMTIFADKAVGFTFPFLPEELSHKEVEHFLKDSEQNAVMYPDALALILAGAALGIQLGGEHEDAKLREDRHRRGDVFVAAVMQALRASGFMSRPTIRSIQAVLIVGSYLTNSGRFLDAWSMFGLTIRLAQSIGLHRNPKYLDPVPELKECTIRSNIWWFMLHMDQLYSMTLGRPLGISGIGDCSPAESLTTNPAVLRLGEFVDQLTLLGRQILSSSQLTDARVDMFTDKLIALWDTIPDTLQFNDAWVDEQTQIPEFPLCATAAVHYCKIHSYIVLLNRQRVENTQQSPEYHSPSPRSALSMHSGPGFSEIPILRPHPMPRGRPMVIQSSSALLDAFIYFYKRVTVALIDWTTGQQAFNACLILLLDALETGETQHIGKIEQAYAVFVELDKNRLHQLAEMAVSRISEGLLLLRDRLESQATTPPGTRSQSVVDTAFADNMHGNHIGAATYDASLETRSHVSSYYNEVVMGNTGMFLLEDPGMQAYRNLSLSVPDIGRSHPPSPSEKAPQEVKPSKPISRRQSTQPIRQKQLYQQAYPQPPVYAQQHTMYHNPSQQPLQTNYNYAASQAPPYAHTRLFPRRDSATAASGHITVQAIGSTCPPIGGPNSYGAPTMQVPLRHVHHPPPPHPSTPMVYQQPSLAPPQLPQLDEQDWHVTNVQQHPQVHAMQQGQMFPPHPPRQ